jgi:hypothetical protein
MGARQYLSVYQDELHGLSGNTSQDLPQTKGNGTIILLSGASAKKHN